MVQSAFGTVLTGRKLRWAVLRRFRAKPDSALKQPKQKQHEPQDAIRTTTFGRLKPSYARFAPLPLHAPVWATEEEHLGLN
eukprot:12886066-Alexandrium_andersonii.AAC.1